MSKSAIHAAVVIPRFYPYRGGYENSVFSVAKCLVERGHRVTVFTTTADDLESLWLPGRKTFPVETLSVDGVTVRRFAISYNRLARRITRLAGILPSWRMKARFWRPGFSVPGLDRAMREIDADVFHIGPLPYNNLMYAGLRAAEFKCKPVIATPCLHLGEDSRGDVARHYTQSHQLQMLRRCDRVFCMTETERRYFASAGVPATKLEVLPYGVDLTKVAGGNPRYLAERHGIDGPVVLHLGMKAYDKGSITLLEAMKTLWAEGSEAWLVMAGPAISEFDQYVTSSAQGLPRFLNLPRFTDEEKRDLLASSTIVAQPSRVESLGLVLFEAWTNGKPVVAAEIPVSRELIERSQGGVLTPFGDSAKLASAIQALLADPQRSRALGLQAKPFACEYDATKVWPRIAEQFEQVAGRYT